MKIINEQYAQLLLLPVLLLLAVADVKKKKVRVASLVVCGFAFAAVATQQEVSLFWRMGGLAFGVLLLVLCRMSHEALGTADGIILLYCGGTFGLRNALLICLFSFLASAVGAGILLLLRRIGRKDRIPFLPFLLAGYSGALFVMNYR